MKRVTGIGGIFFKARDPVALRAWYKKHLGIDVQDWGGAAFTWTGDDGKPTAGTTIWSIGSDSADAYAPSRSSFMINYRVADLAALLKVLREEGCNVLDRTDDSEYGKFGWVMDPEGEQGRTLAAACRELKLMAVVMRLLCAIVLLSLAACASSESEQTSQAPPEGDLYRVDPPESILRAARAFMEQDRFAALITVDANGQPRVRTVRAYLNDVDPEDPRKGMTVWIMTRDSTRKVDQIRRNSNVTLYFNDDAKESYVSIMGHGTVYTDPNDPRVQPSLPNEEDKVFFWPEFPKGFVMIEVQPRWVEYIGPDVPNHEISWRPQAVSFVDGAR